MKLLLTILACLVAASAGAQTIKSLGYNTTNGRVVYSSSNALTFTNSSVVFSNIQLGIFGTGGDTGFVSRSSGGLFTLHGTNVSTSVPAFYGWSGTANTAFSAGTARTNLGLGGTNDVSFSRLSLSNGATNNLAVTLGATNRGFSALSGPDRITTTVAGISAFSVFSNSIETGAGVVATFATNVSIAGSLTVGSFTTTTPSTWALDATQTAAATNGRLTLPSNANVLRLTNNNAISSVTNGVLGAFYYLVNQATNAVTISNVGGITIDGGQNLTLSPNESATLVATGPTNVSVVNRGDLTDVALGGTLNTAPSQTNAASASSLMTRGLSDDRYRIFYVPLVHVLSQTAANGATWNLRPFHSSDAVFSVPPWARNVRVYLSTGFTNAPVSNNFTAVITAYTLTGSNSFGIPYSPSSTNVFSATSVWSNGSNSHRFIFGMTNDIALPSAGIADAESASFWNVLIQVRNDSSASLTTVADNWLRGMAVFTD